MKEALRVLLSVPEVHSRCLRATWRGVDPAPLLEAVSSQSSTTMTPSDLSDLSQRKTLLNRLRPDCGHRSPTPSFSIPGHRVLNSADPGAYFQPDDTKNNLPARALWVSGTQRSPTSQSYLAHSLLPTSKMDPATAALQSCANVENINITALAKGHGVPMTTVWHRHHGRATGRDRGAKQQYLTPSEEKALTNFLLQWSDYGNPVRIKFLRSLAFSIARQRSPANEAIKPPGRN
jgi:hypothetical protein